MLLPSNIDTIATYLKAEKIGVMPSDTIYGLFGLASSKKATERAFQTKRRPLDKPFIYLISDYAQLQTVFGVTLSTLQYDFCQKHWPGPVSMGLASSAATDAHIHRHVNHFAVRKPDNSFLISIINQTGPLFATSANISSNDVVTTCQQAVDIFKGLVDFYVDGGIVNASASSIYSLQSEPFTKIR